MARSTKKPASKPTKKPGKVGGARPGSGRKPGKREPLPADVIERLGPPPKTTRELREWNGRLLAEVQWLSINGKIGPDLAASIRANAGSLDRALPSDPRPPSGASGAGDDDDDQEDDEGPELEDAPVDGSLRVG